MIKLTLSPVADTRSIANRGDKSITEDRGGTGFLVRDSISNFVNVIPSESEYISWLKLSKQFHMYDEDIILGCVHIPPQQSRFFNDDEFECMEQEITSACSLSQYVYICTNRPFE